MANNFVGIKFGVLGGASTSGESYQLIKTQLDSLSNKIKFKVNIDRPYFTKQLQSLKAEMNKTLGNLKIDINTVASNSSSSASDATRVNGTSQQSEEYKNLLKQLSEIESKSKQVFSVLREDSHVFSKYNEQLNSLQASFEETFSNARSQSLISDEEINQIQQERDNVLRLIQDVNELTEAKRADKLATMNDNYSKLYAKAVEGVGGRYADLIKSNAEAKESYEQLIAAANNYRNAINGGNYHEAIAMQTAFKDALANTSATLSELQVKTDTIGKKLLDTMKNKIVQVVSYAVIGIMTRALKQVYDNVLKIDAAMTSLKIVTNANSQEMSEFADTVAKSAKKIGSSISDLIDSTTVFARLGYSLSDASILAEKTTIYSNVADVAVDEATTNITAIIKAFNVGAEELESVLDQLIYVGNNFAISSGEIGEGMNNAASSLAANGNTLQQAIGILTAANVTVQNANKSSTAVRTIAARMAGSTTELEELGEETENVLSSAKLDEKMRAYGISILDATGDLRTTYDVLADISNIWDDLNNVDRAAIAEMLSGTRQQNVFYSMMQNWGDAEAVVDEASSAYGSLSSAQDKYLDSIDGKLNQLEATWQTFSANLLDSDVVKTAVDILTGIANAFNFVVSNVNVLRVAVSLLIATGGIGLLKQSYALLNNIATSIKNVGSSVKTAFSKDFSESLKEICSDLANTQTVLKTNTDALNELSNETGYSTSTLNSFYKQAMESGDATTYYNNATRLTSEQQERLNELSNERVLLLSAEEQQTGKLTNQINALNTAMSTVAMVGTLAISILSQYENTGAKITTIVVSIATVLAIAIPVIVKLVKTGVNGIKTALQSLNSIPIIAIITAILTAIMALINAISWLCKADERAKEAAQENAKALQEEADALREVSDAAKEAADSISELIDEMKALSDDMSNAEWYHYLDELGAKINNLYSDEELSSLEAINKLLGTTYTYDELMRLSTAERLALLEKINDASIKETQNQQKSTYEAQKAASTATVQATGMKEKIKTDSHDVIEEFLDKIYAGNEEGISVYNTAGKNFKVKIDSKNAKDFVERVQKIVDAYEEEYKDNLSELQDNDIYVYFANALKEGKVALQEQMSDIFNYLDTTTKIIAMDIPVDLNAEDLEMEYQNLIESIFNAVQDDNTIATALTEGILEAENITEYATAYIATYYEDLYNAVNKSAEAISVVLKDLLDILNEVEDEYDTLVDAVDDMNKIGIVSADTFKTIKEDFPDLLDYLTKTADGYLLAEDALSKYMNTQSSKYLEKVKSAQEYFDAVYAEYEESEGKTVEEYEKVIAAQEALSNAISNAEEWQITEAILTRESLIDEYTELLEAQSDALDDQCDKYKELCEIRQDLLKTYQEEIDKKKELNKKQSNVADLQTQLALARLDNSAAGRAKVRELEAELAEAEEELEEYSLELAIEDICNDIDDALTEYENWIQQQIDEIESTISSIVTMSTNSIVSAIEGIKAQDGNTGESQEGYDSDDLSSRGTDYNNTIQDATTSASKTVSEANTVAADSDSDEEENLPTYTITKASNNTGLNIGSSKYSKDDYLKKIIQMPNGDVYFPYTTYGNKDKYVKKGEGFDVVWQDGKYKIDFHSWKPLYSITSSYHTGGFVGDYTKLASNEIYAKLLKGEFVSTPAQMDRFINETLPKVAAHQNGDATINYNSPLVEIKCGTVNDDTLPKLNDMVNKAVEKIKKDMSSALSRTGYRKQY